MIVKKRILKKIIKEELSRFLTESEYTVRRGDNLSRIARSHGVSLSDLLSVNPQFDRSLLRSQGSGPGPDDFAENTSGRNPNWIFSGEVIQIPGSTEGGPSSARVSSGPIAGLEMGSDWSGSTSSSPIPGLEMGSDWSGSTSSSTIPGLEMGSDWRDRHPPSSAPSAQTSASDIATNVASSSTAGSTTGPAGAPSSATTASSSSSASGQPPTQQEPQAPVDRATVATQGSGPISVSGTGGRTHSLEIDRRGRVKFAGKTYELEADVMGGVSLEVDRIDASRSPVMITVDPAVGRTQTKPIRPYGIAQMEDGAGRSQFRIEPDPSGPDPSSPTIIFTAV